MVLNKSRLEHVRVFPFSLNDCYLDSERFVPCIYFNLSLKVSSIQGTRFPSNKLNEKIYIYIIEYIIPFIIGVDRSRDTMRRL